jgi:hypothetical protein
MAVSPVSLTSLGALVIDGLEEGVVDADAQATTDDAMSISRTLTLHRLNPVSAKPGGGTRHEYAIVTIISFLLRRAPGWVVAGR